MKKYILEHDARINACRESIDNFDVGVIKDGSFYIVQALDAPEYDIDDFIAGYSQGKCVFNPEWHEV